MKIISSLDNKYVKLASSLQHRKYRIENKMFMVEGRRAVAEALEKPELIRAVFVEERLLPEYAGLEAIPAERLLQVDKKLMRHICSTEHPQGVAVIMQKPFWSWEELSASPGLLVLLDRIADPGNMGSILRSCWAFGVDAVLLRPGCVDPFSPKVVRSTMGAIMHVPVFTEFDDGRLHDLQRMGFRFIATDAKRGSPYHKIAYTRPLILVIGSEAEGISAAVNERCGQFVNIPMRPEVDSLNVAAACAIIISEAWKQYREGTDKA